VLKGTAGICSGLSSLRFVTRLKFNRSKTKTNHDLLTRICFPALLLAWNSHWFIVCLTSAVIGQSDYFGFGFTQLKTAVKFVKLIPNISSFQHISGSDLM